MTPTIHDPALDGKYLWDWGSLAFDAYDLGDQVLLVASDQVRLFGKTVHGLIPNKGKALTQIAVYWYELFESIIGSNLISADVADYPPELAGLAEVLAGRSLLLKKVEQFPLEAIVYGYLTPEVLREYIDEGTVGGVESERGLMLNSQLPQCIYIPYELNDEGRPWRQSDLMQTVELYGMRLGMVLCSNALELYEIVGGLSLSRGLVMAEMCLRFGQVDDQVVVTAPPLPDDSLCWLAEGYRPGQMHDPFILGPLIKWLSEALDEHWREAEEAGAEPRSRFVEAEDPLPEPPTELLVETGQRYVQACEMLTAEDFWG